MEPNFDITRDLSYSFAEKQVRIDYSAVMQKF